MSFQVPQSEQRGVIGRAEWTRRPERGGAITLRLMALLSLYLGRTATRVILHLIVSYFFLFTPTARGHARNYLQRALGRQAKAADWFRLLLSFASVTHDRIYLLRGRYSLFRISSQGEELLAERLRKRQGAVLVGAHVGSFEIVRAVGLQQPGLEIAMAMYQENARKVGTMLAAIAPGAAPEIIALGQLDAMLRIRERTEAGALVGMLGDRSLGDEPGQSVNFLGSPAYLPLGPLRAAALLRQPVIFMLGLYAGGNRYHVVFESLADFSDTPAGERAASIQLALIRYAQLLEKYCRLYPYNWFNFYDFWQRPQVRTPDQVV